MADTENSVKRILPHDNNAERSIIGSMLMDPDAISDVSGILIKEDFYNAQYGILFEAIRSLHDEGKSVDEVILAERLRSMGAPEGLYEMSYLGDILAAQTTSVFAVDYANIVREKSLLRQLIRTADNIAKECYEGQGEPGKIIERAEDAVYKVAQSESGNREFASMQSIVVSNINQIEEASKNEGRVNGLPTGFIDLDHKLTGLHKGELILVAARPAMGKTAFVLNIANHVVMKEKTPVVIFSLEMDKESLVSRMLAMNSRVEAQSLRTGQLTDDDWDRIIDAAEELSRVPLFIADDSSVTISELRSKCRKLKQREGIGLVILDYLQLMNASRPVESRQQFISEVSRSLKGLARELGVPVIALSQLNREVDKRTDHKPVLADLRESGAIEQDADVVIFISREDYYDPETERKGIATIDVAKQRNGSTGPIDLLWEGKYTQFLNMEHTKERGR